MATKTYTSERTGTPVGTSSSATPTPDRRWWILALLCVAQVMVVLDTTVVSIALPTAQHDLGFSNSDRQWIVTAYALAFGSLLLIGGRLADFFGRKRVFVIGLGGFALASAFGGLAQNFTMLVAARAIQGLFGALLAPAALSLLTTTFSDPKDRGKAFGIFGAISGAGGAVGLLLGGVLTEYASWRSTLFVNLFFAGLAILGASLFLTDHNGRSNAKLDWPGTVAVSAGLFSLVYGLSHAASGGWDDAVTLTFLAAAAVLLAVFVGIQVRTSHPLLPMRVLADRDRGGAYFAILAAASGMFAIFLFLTYYLESTRGFSAVRTGLAFVPLTGILVVTSSVGSTVLNRRVSPRIMVPAGFLTAAAGMAWLTQIGLHTGYFEHILGPTLIMGAGLGFVFSTCLNLATLGVDARDAGVASAAVNTMQQVGGSIGTALLNTIAASAVGSYLASHAGASSLASLAAIHSYTVSFWWATGIFAGAGVILAVALRSGIPQVDPESAPIPVA